MDLTVPVGVADLTLLEKLEEASMMDNIQKRFEKDRIYTSIGDVIIAFNPYKKIDIYGDKVLQMYKGKNIYELPPHMYDVFTFIFVLFAYRF